MSNYVVNINIIGFSLLGGTMKQYGFKYNNFGKLQSFIYNKRINKYDKILVQIFTGVIQSESIEQIINEIIYLLPQAEIIGATTGGEILKNRAYVGSTVISITVFEETKIKSKLLNCNNNEYELGRNIAKELVEEDTKVLILFTEGLLTTSGDILKGIREENSNVIVCGGKAGDNGSLKETFVFTKAGISNNGVAVVSLSGEKLNVTTDQSLGWSTIGKSMIITKAENNRIYTIDNMKIVDIYKKYLGEEVAKKLPMSAVQFPLIAIENGIQIGKIPSALNEDGSLSFFNNFEVNDKVKFGYGNANMVIDNSLEICNKLMKRNVEALFVYSCFVRRSFLQKKVNFNISSLNNIAPTAGFFTYGEFFTTNNSNRLLNVAMTVLGISEGKQKVDNESVVARSRNKSFLEGKDQGVIEAFTKLVDEATKELEETNEILEEQKRKLKQMNSVTKSILQMNSEIISSGEFNQFIEGILDKILNVITKGKMGSILLVEDNKLCYKAGRGYDFEKMKKITYSLKNIYKYNEKHNSEIFNPIIIENTEKDCFLEPDKYDSWVAIFDKRPIQVLNCCIGVDGEVAGLITLMNTQNEKSFDEGDKRILQYISYDIAVALKNFRLLENILYMSRYDSLTGACKRSYFRELLKQNIEESKISGATFVICLIDLNDFKIINDTYGHNKGDEVLINFVKVFKSEIDEKDILGRIGGDEFSVIFINKNKEQVIERINRISEILNDYDLKIEGKAGNISFAYGLAECLIDSENMDELIKIADNRMYGKKRKMKE